MVFDFFHFYNRIDCLHKTSIDLALHQVEPFWKKIKYNK